MKKIKPLPPSNDEFWDGETKTHNPIDIKICPTHTKVNWMSHKGYKDNHDGTISCVFCPWGTRVPGYIKMVNGVLYDLRTINRD